MARKKKIEKMRVIELQSYLKGIVAFSGDDWVPSKEQWDMIYELIMNVKDEEPVEVLREVAQQQQYPDQRTQQPMTRHPQAPVQIEESTLDQTGQQFEPIVPNAPQQDLRKVIPKQGASKVAGGGQVPSSGVTIVTGNKEADETESDFL